MEVYPSESRYRGKDGADSDGIGIFTGGKGLESLADAWINWGYFRAGEEGFVFRLGCY